MTTAALTNPVPAASCFLGASPVPGELLRLAGEYLKAGGIPVKLGGEELLIAPAARPRSKRKARETRAARCTLDVADDCATARLHFVPWAAGTADARWIADVASAALTSMACTGPRRPDVKLPPDIGFKGAVGLDLRRRGFEVGLNVYEDPDYLEFFSDIAVTVPGWAGAEAGGVAYVADDGAVCWERCYWDQYTVTGRGPGFRSWLPDPPAVARAIIGTIGAVVRTAWPELDAG